MGLHDYKYVAENYDFYLREIADEDGFVDFYSELAMRQTHEQEMRYLIELCGYEVVNVYGGYKKEPVNIGELIWILKR